MRIPSGKTDQLIFFVAVDSTDLKTRKTGLTTFTVYRSRNGGSATAYTTPSVAELSAANMPGVYSLAIDEDTTIGASSDSEEYCVHITQASMAPVTRTLELYRRDTTSGRTLDVSAGGEAGLDWANVGSPTTANALTGTTIATTQKVDVETIKTNPVVNAGTVTFPTTATLASTTNITAGTITTVTTATNLTNLPSIPANWITAAGITAAALDGKGNWNIGKTGYSLTQTFPANFSDLAITLTTGRVTVGTNADKTGYALTTSNWTTTADIPSAAAIADQVWDEAISGHLTAGSTGNALNAAGSAGDPWATPIPGAYGLGTAGKILGDNINAPIATVDTVVDAIKLKTDSLNFTKAGEVDANIYSVNDAAVTGDGNPGSEWGP